MWQAIHRDSYVEPQKTGRGTYTTKAGSSETDSTDLTPFYVDSNSFWDSEGVKETETFGYAYPETQSWNYETVDKYKASINAAINQLYRGSSLATIIASSSPGNLSPSAQMKKQPEVQPEDSPVPEADADSIGTSAVEQQPDMQPEAASTQDREVHSVKSFSTRKLMVTSTNGHHSPDEQKPMEAAETERKLPQSSKSKGPSPQGSGSHESEPQDHKPENDKPQESKEDDSSPQQSRLKHYRSILE